MEIVENCCTVVKCPQKPSNQENKPANVKCKKRYVQPPRTQPFTPKSQYCPPTQPIDAKTVYCTSYFADAAPTRPEPVFPKHSIALSKDVFARDTTTNLSYVPVWQPRARPIVPRSRLLLNKGKIDDTTTVRASYQPKYMEKSEPIMPCGHIKLPKGAIETKTTTVLSYMNPGPCEQQPSYKPHMEYCRPQVPIHGETTQKLSFLPFEVSKKENYPWARKPCYKKPEVPIGGETTYKKSYFENKTKRVVPVLPKDAGVFQCGQEFYESTIYRESFLPSKTERVEPVYPCSNIKLSTKKMTGSTTNKLSFQPVQGDKRKPILPRKGKIQFDAGFNEKVTTTQMSYIAKASERAQMIMPCGQIQKANQPLEGTTTTALSYMRPGNVQQYGSFKPVRAYCRPEQKIDGETVNMLSFQQWKIGPKEDLPWARKPCYKRPEAKIAGETVTHMSFPTPGYYVEECVEEEVAQDCCKGKDSGDHCEVICQEKNSGACCDPCDTGAYCDPCDTGARCDPCDTPTYCDPCDTGARCDPCDTGANYDNGDHCGSTCC